MTAKLTKADLSFFIATMEPLLFPPARDLAPEQRARLGDALSRLRGLHDAARPMVERGDLVLEWRIPNEWTATKCGKGKTKWILGNIKNKLGDNVRSILPVWPRADLCLARRRRWVQVRRYSDQKPDRPHCPDCLGARQAIDTLKDLGVIVDDSTEWTVDDSNWIKCKRGQTHVVIRVFELSTEGRYWPEPECLPPPRPEKKRGAIVASIVGGDAASKLRGRRKRKPTCAAVRPTVQPSGPTTKTIPGTR